MGLGGLLKRAGKWLIKTIIREAKEEIVDAVEDALDDNTQDRDKEKVGDGYRTGIPRK